MVNTLRPRQNGSHFADDLFKCSFFNENVWNTIKISITFIPKGPNYNIPSLVQILAWRRTGDKPLSEPMMARLLTHICVTRPQWVKWFTWIYNMEVSMNEKFCIFVKILLKLVPRSRIANNPALVQIKAWHQKERITKPNTVNSLI